MGLRKKTFIYVGAGIATVIIVVALFALQSINQSVELASRQNLAIASNIALNIDDTLMHLSAEVEYAGQIVSNNMLYNPGESGVKERLTSLKTSLQRYLSVEQADTTDVFVALLDEQGTILQMEPILDVVFVGQSLANIPTIMNALQTGQAYTVVDRSILTGDSPTLSMVAPIKDAQGLIRGLIVADIPAVPGAFDPFLNNWVVAHELEIVTEKGLVIASSTPQTSIKESEHWDLIHQLAEERSPGIIEHSKSEHKRAHIVVFAPIKQAPWGVVMEESKEEILQLPWIVGQRLLVASGIAAVIAAVLIWGFTQQVLNRIRRLAVIAEKFGTGDLEVEVPQMQQDEIGRLAQSFESMRRRLKQSLDEISRWNQELEQRVKARTTELETLYQQLHRRDEERSNLLGKIITAQEEERRRVARELHDDISQTLTGVTMAIGSIEALIANEPTAAKRGLETLRQTTSEAVDNTRRLIRNLRPSLLDDLGLVPAISWYVENYLNTSGVKTKFETSGSDKGIPPMVQIVLFRVIQEAITNIVKHARAKTAYIYLQFNPYSIVGRIEDDGQGFNTDALHIEKHEGVGLLGMEERIELLKGKLTIESKLGEGTQVRFEIPK